MNDNIADVINNMNAMGNKFLSLLIIPVTPMTNADIVNTGEIIPYLIDIFIS
jgi:hypothetical protein